jgi:transposase-like protein
MKRYRKFDLEFKQRVVNEVQGGQLSLTQAAREYDLSPTLVRRWCERATEGRLAGTPSAPDRALVRELERYKRKVAELLLENDLLKNFGSGCDRTKNRIAS